MTKIDDGPELFIGLAAAVGTNLDGVVNELTTALRAVRYHSHEIRLANLDYSLNLVAKKERML